jgi:hypothetical protein
MRGFQAASSFFSTLSTITGLQVAPTAPLSSMDARSSVVAQESFQSAVGVVRVMRWSRVSGLLIGLPSRV